MPKVQEVSSELQPVISILKSKSVRYKQLVESAMREMKVRKNPAGYNAEMRKGAQLLIDLPLEALALVPEIRSYRHTQLVRELGRISARAAQMLNAGDYFRMPNMLFSYNTPDKGRDDLEELIALLERPAL